MLHTWACSAWTGFCIPGGCTVKKADVALAMPCAHRQWDAQETMKKMLNSQCKMDLPVQPIKGETKQNPSNRHPKMRTHRKYLGRAFIF